MAHGTVTNSLIDSHLDRKGPEPGEEIALSIDQSLTQDATGTLVMLELEQLGLERVKTEVSAQYVDHNLLQEDFKNPDDHQFLQSACQRFGVHYSRPGNGVSHAVHMARFGQPGKTLLGSDSHTCAAGSMGMLAIGAGGMDVAQAMAGRPFHVKMPQVWGVKLTGELSPWVSAKDVILEMLRRHGVDGGVGKIIEYHGPGLKGLSAMDRHVIANMGAELGATTTVFPSDEQTYEYLLRNQRGQDWRELKAQEDCEYDLSDEIDLSSVEPLIAKPSSPGNVVPVREVEGEEIFQSYIGSSANPGFRDFAVPAQMLKDRNVHPKVSFDVNPTSREVLENLSNSGHLATLIHAGARIHQAGCNGCIGMGQAPASGRNSLRTTPRNFPGRSGTKEDSVWLCSPETATASAINGKMTDPRSLEQRPPEVSLKTQEWVINEEMISTPLDQQRAQKCDLIKGPNIKSLPEGRAPGDKLEALVALKVGDDISTDEILPAGARVLPYRSNIQKISEFCFENIDSGYAQRAWEISSGHVIVGAKNYGQGSSREHAALAPAYLGLKAVIAKSFARIHWQNLISFGVLPLEFAHEEDYDRIRLDQKLSIDNLKQQLRDAQTFWVQCDDQEIELTHRLSPRQVEVYLCGGMIPWLKENA